jgi:pectate lyase
VPRRYFGARQLVLVVLLVLHGQIILADQLAFPGAEGYGRFATGGRGGDVYHVTNLNDDGAGSLREGIDSATGPRTIVFDVSGNIMADSRIRVDEPDITIAGQTAPGDGITINHGFEVKASNVIVRFIRARLGDAHGEEIDAVGITSGSNIILDHVTASWSVDETLSCQSENVDLLTVQWCMVTESLRDSIHEKGKHGYGGIIGSIRQSFHHNLYAHHSSRNPKVTGRRHCEVDFRNNVIYNWGYNSCYDGTASYINWANNYYKSGPATSSGVRDRIFKLSDQMIPEDDSPQDSYDYETSLYAEGNYVDGYPAVTADNWDGGIDFDNGASEEQNRNLIPYGAHNLPTPAGPAPAITEQTAEDAYPLVVAMAGASLVRDSIDTRIAGEVLTGTVTYYGSKTGDPGIIDSQTDVGGWPTLNSLPAPTDTDQDGIPDTWETANGLSPTNAGDRNDYDLDPDYTNLEVYLNELVEHLFPEAGISIIIHNRPCRKLQNR